MKPDRTYQSFYSALFEAGGIQFGRGTVLMTFTKNWRPEPRKSKGWRRCVRNRKAARRLGHHSTISRLQ